MKSKDQYLLEEAYKQILEGKYTTNYGMSKFKPKGKPLSDFDDSAREELRNDERNAGVEEDDYVEPAPAAAAPSSTAPSTTAPTAPTTIDFDPSSLRGKKIDYTVWDYPSNVITINGRPTGGEYDEKEAKQLVQMLNSAPENPDVVNNPMVQRFLLGVKNLNQMDALQ